jgi:HEAT repeat protein
MALRLLKCLARAIAKHGSKLISQVFPWAEALYEIAADAYQDYRQDQQHDDLRAEVQALAQAPPEQVRQEVRTAVQVAAGDQPADVQRTIVAYLNQVPAMVRRSLRRPSDPTGTTVPAALAFRGPDDLLPFLPPRPPRFKRGDRPLPGVDWVLEEPLGVGGFGEVWKARHAHLRSKPPVALKFCLDAAAAPALRNEAGILDRVMQHGRHPGIVPLLQTYLSAEPPCLEYEYVEGDNLMALIREWHQRGQMKPDTATRLVLQLAETVAFAHQASPPIVHGDLKPANILVRRTKEGKIALRVTDFGIGGLAAARAALETRKASRSRHELLTEAVRGDYTPLYASLEQMKRRPGESPDPRDDVHALGVVWYQLVTGDMEMLSVPPDWKEQLEQRGLAAGLVNLLRACISRKAEARPASAVAVAQRLRAALHSDETTPAGSPGQRAPERTGRAGPWRLLVVGLAIPLSVVLYLVLYGIMPGPSDLPADPPGPLNRSKFEPKEGEPPTPPDRDKGGAKKAVPSGPLYRGKTLAQWGQALKEGDAKLREEAAAALVEAESRAVPVLAPDLRDTNADVRVTAASTLGRIGRSAVPALPQLVGCLQDPEARVRGAAANSIGEICDTGKVWHEQALQALCERLKDGKEEPAVRRSAAFALGCMRKGDSPKVMTALDAGLKDADAAVRQKVTWALGFMGDRVTASLRQALQDDDPLVRTTAAVALGRLSPDAAHAAKPELIRCCQDQIDPARQAAYTEMRKAAICALVRLLGPGDGDARPTLLAALQDPETEIRWNAALALGSIGGPEAVPAVPVLLTLLRKDDNNGKDKEALALRRMAALAFRNIGPDAKAALPDLRKALRSPDKELRFNAAVALIGFKGVGEPAVPDLVQLVRDPKEDIEVRKQAAVALSRIGYNQELEQAIHALLGVIGNSAEVGAVRERTLWVMRPYLLNTQQPKREPVFKIMGGIVAEPRRYEIKMLRYDSAYLLGMFKKGKVDEKALDVLDEFLHDPGIKVFVGGRGTSSATGEAAKGSTGFKEQGKGDGRIMAVDALRVIGAVRVATRPNLILRLLKLEADPATADNLRDGLEAALVSPDMVQQIRRLQGARTTAPELRAAINAFLPRLPALEKKVQARQKQVPPR